MEHWRFPCGTCMAVGDRFNRYIPNVPLGRTIEVTRIRDRGDGTCIVDVRMADGTVFGLDGAVACDQLAGRDTVNGVEWRPIGDGERSYL